MRKSKHPLMIKKSEILALIPARGGSSGLPDKNIRPLLGTPLIAHTIEAALVSNYITRTIVSTDSDQIATVARSYGAEVPYKRPADISLFDSHFFQVIKHSVQWLEENEGYQPDIVCSLLCTTPMRTTQDIDKCMKLMTDTGCDWCFTVNEMEHHPWRAMIVNGDNMRALFDVPREKLWSNRQELPLIHRMNGGVIAGKREHIANHNEYNIDNLQFTDTDVRCVVMPPERSLDIDTLMDFNMVQEAMKLMK